VTEVGAVCKTAPSLLKGLVWEIIGIVQQHFDVSIGTNPSAQVFNIRPIT